MKRALIIKALLVVDVQNNFAHAGELTVPKADKVVPALNRYIRLFTKRKLPIFASHDWQLRRKHFNFEGKQPPRGLQKSKKASFHPELRLPKQTIILYKGMSPKKDKHSLFQTISFNGNDFRALLNFLGIKGCTNHCGRGYQNIQQWHSQSQYGNAAKA